MNTNEFYRLDSISVMDVVGVDAAKIVHNLTTNEVTTLATGTGCETFITNVRGKTLGHVVVFRTADSLRMIGAGGQSEQIAQHVDRYTISEDASTVIRDAEYVALALPNASAEVIGVKFSADDTLHSIVLRIGELDAQAYETPWLGRGSVVVLIPAGQASSAIAWLEQQSIKACDDVEFQSRRTMIGFPWYGVDMDDTNLPQESDRIAEAISFTKGCYLGQETVARLDAMGQVQKKLVRWSVSGAIPRPGAKLTADDKTVGRLTSVAAGGDEDAIAIGYARRSHFDRGSTALGVDELSATPIAARVL